MRVVSEHVLATFRAKTRCEFCLRSCSPDPHHLASKGAGRVDAAFNIAGLCRHCHSRSHAGHAPHKSDLLQLVAMRERTTPEAITEAVAYLRALDKDGREVRQLPMSDDAWRLVGTVMKKRKAS